MTIFALGALLVLWALLVAGISKLAQDRGRFLAGWAIGAAAAGVLGFAAGVELIGHVVIDEASDAVLIFSMLTPVALLFLPMAAIGIVLLRLPVKVAPRSEWPVHFVNRGPGRISIQAGIVRFEWPDGSRAAPIDQLRRVDADGECVRIGGAEDLELVALPMGKPATPAGRKKQSQVLARRLGGATGR